jgi:hypothetical protein
MDPHLSAEQIQAVSNIGKSLSRGQAFAFLNPVRIESPSAIGDDDAAFLHHTLTLICARPPGFDRILF